MDKREVAAALAEIADLLELTGENRFRVRSYRAAARGVDTYPGSLPPALGKDDWERIPGVGGGLAEKIAQLWETGSLLYLDELRARVPAGLREMLAIPGLGPRKVRTLHEKLQLTTVGELEYACLENRLVELPGFGVRSQENILRGIERLKRYRGRFLLPTALGVAEEFGTALKNFPGVRQVALAGELRRRRETVERVELAVALAADGGGASAAGSPLGESLQELAGVVEVVTSGPGKIVAHTEAGVPVALLLGGEEDFALRLLAHTGSEEHLALLRARGRGMGIRFEEGGLFRGKKPVACEEEESIYRTLELPLIPPELREGRDELDLAGRGELDGLVRARDIQGMLHVHSDYSDGVVSLAELARAAAAGGYGYLGIADHSRSAGYAGGLSIERVKEQQEEIARLNEGKLPIPILAGIESDILPDGSLDYPDEVLASFDFVIASVHSRFRMSKEEMTARVVRAIENPYTSILGHPTGRLLLAREPYEIDLEAVIDACARQGVAVELNANPHRLDIDWREIPRARTRGVTIAINPDAHRIEGMADMTYGVAIARKGGLKAGDVLNTRDVDGAREFFRSRRIS